MTIVSFWSYLENLYATPHACRCNCLLFQLLFSIGNFDSRARFGPAVVYKFGVPFLFVVDKIMVHFNQILSGVFFATAAFAKLQKANDSPEGAKYVAKFDNKLQGQVEFAGTSNGSVSVSVKLEGLPETGGPFPYHVHELPVPSNGDCMGTKLHLNPYNGSSTATTLDDTEVGDLARRHGNLTAPSDDITYIDEYLSLNSDSPAFIGGRSVVVHFLNNSRIACANITQENKGSNNNSTSTESVSETNGASTNSAGFTLGAFAVALGMMFC